MQIDYCLILAAGHGTRMGKIGESLPKVLWPVFEKTLLELQVAYAKSLGVKNIYINLFNKAGLIKGFIQNKSIFENVKFLIEGPEILDIGGAVHNLASQSEVNYRGRLLVLNADQFFYLTPIQFSEALNGITPKPFILFTYMVNSSEGYNALSIDPSRSVIEIIQNAKLPQNIPIETYTGISVIDLSELKRVSGPSKFFESVCPLGSGKVIGVSLKDYDYWDFGTSERYWNTLFRIVDTYKENSNHPFLRFLVKERALKTWKINLVSGSYNSGTPRVINQAESNTSPDFLGPAIILDGPIGASASGKIHYHGITMDYK